ncbi:MAG: glycosyltransferase family 4 protein, partial [Candidatus Kapabacteria bacterium]|nr:glycosyltransferase family 4 protein [Candidatus Kapabacteria bacterium]
MVIAYDASQFAGQSGIERYSRELIRAMLHTYPDDRIRLIGDTTQEVEIRGIIGKGTAVDVRPAMTSEHRVALPFRRLVRMVRERQLTSAARGADIVHLLGPQKIVPKATRLAVTIHDLFPMDEGMELDPILARRFPARVTQQLRSANVVLTPSAYVAGTIRERFPWYHGPIRVTPLAASDAFRPMTLDDATRSRYGIERSFLLFIGRVDGRKNLRRILAAWMSLPPSMRSEHDLVLLVPGTDDALQRLRQEHAATFRDASVRLLSNIPSADMVGLLSAARALVFTTLGEGFGLPVVEAMRCGCPVITSNITALPEVGGNAVLYVDPRREDEIADAMAKCLLDDALVDELRQRGLERGRSFTWEATARATHDA